MKKILLILCALEFTSCAAIKQHSNGKAAIDSMNNLDTISAKQFRIYTIKK